MKLCPNCRDTFDHAGWQCPHCHSEPTKIHGFYSFAPELAEANDGLNENAHHMLDQLQARSFWFRERNSLIQYMIKRFFPQSQHILEIGCGSGYVLNGIRDARPTASLTATEIYSYSLNYASNRVSEPCEFLQVDARRLPFKQEFDLVGAFDVLEHIEEHEVVIKNIRNSLKPGGGAIFTVPQHPWLWSNVDAAACHKRRYTRKELALLLKDQQFEVVHDTSFMFFLLPLLLLQRLLNRSRVEQDPTVELTLPKWIDTIFAFILKCERLFIRLGIKFPLGGSRLVVARLKNEYGYK